MGLDVAESARISLSALLANKGRGALTALGIIIGIVAVITTMTAANGLANNFRDTFSAIGADVVYVSRMPWIIRGPDEFARFNRRPQIELEDSERLAHSLRGRAIVNPYVDTRATVRYRDKSFDSAQITGTTDKQVYMSGSLPESGRFLMPFDLQYRRAVAVIGWEIKERLFGDVDPIGEKIRVGRRDFRVVGVTAKQGKGVFGGLDTDLEVFIPVSTFAKIYGSRRNSLEVDLAVKAVSPDVLADLEFEVMGEFRKIRKLRPDEEENFSINKLDTLVDAYNSIMGVVVGVGLMVTGIALFVGGVGVMNIMFVSVTERTREIGIRKAIGARRRSILMQFMFEAGVICLFGGLVGIFLAWLVTMLINATLMPASISPSIAVTAIAISLLVGMLAGIAPAWKGARQDPIEALRYE
jgi:putative ABC transport system permease protein